MGLRIFHAIVTQFDCSEYDAKRYNMERRGPLLFECYLGMSEDDVRKHAESFKGYGWVRVAEVTVNIPEGD